MNRWPIIASTLLVAVANNRFDAWTVDTNETQREVCKKAHGKATLQTRFGLYGPNKVMSMLTKPPNNPRWFGRSNCASDSSPNSHRHNQEVMVVVPHKAGSRYTFEMMGRAFNCTLHKSKQDNVSSQVPQPPTRHRQTHYRCDKKLFSAFHPSQKLHHADGLRTARRQ